MMSILGRLRHPLLRLLGHERGATMVEYGLMVALVAVVVAVAAATLGQGIAGTFDDVADGLQRCAKVAENPVGDPAKDNVGGWKCHQ